ncbi:MULTISPECIES: hypothetical protein [unclassified Leifsonia]|uniref:hypothetical protein n=1 Tax=unclassified Leifsonia TaxID=2663824 RepID=UPI0008A7A3C9|nr:MULTISPECIES: hypothetical protein [unclassified Leifsonia]SEH79681.1 hypothetical protein SAMN04515694_104109 [Leifsonia sp. CL154]SFL42032.1 hypothetical protein SAMN04515692_104108 [Leifsonia sp. CL147]
MIIQPDSLEHLILYLAEDDWLELGNTNAYAGDFETDLSKRKSLLTAVVRRLSEAGYIGIGDLQYRDPGAKTGLHWAEWPGSLDEQIAHLVEIYTPERRDDDNWRWACWFNLTEQGRRIVETLPEPDDRFFDGLV